MTLPTGVKKKQVAFTLVEVLVATAILSLATVTIVQSNMMNLNVYGRFSNRMGVQNWAEEKLWEAKEEIMTAESPEIGRRSGVYETEERSYDWSLEISQGESVQLYSVLLQVRWQETGKQRLLERFSYVFKPE